MDINLSTTLSGVEDMKAGLFLETTCWVWVLHIPIIRINDSCNGTYFYEYRNFGVRRTLAAQATGHKLCIVGFVAR
jgi:hypothetical protein